jgi:8-oxo-dGTP diphosphatase
MKRTLIVCGLIEQSDNRFLLACSEPDREVSRQWHFPRGPAKSNESAESAMRRVAWEGWGLGVEIVTGQPPVGAVLDGRPVELRYFFCAITHGEVHPAHAVEWRWVPKEQLPEYEYDDASRPVAEWLMRE